MKGFHLTVHCTCCLRKSDQHDLKMTWKQPLLPCRRSGMAMQWENTVWRLESYFKSNGCFLLIELDEVFDRKSIKRDGASRQLQSAEGSFLYYSILYYSSDAVWKMRRNPSSVTTVAINTTSGHSCHSALKRHHEEYLLKVNEIANHTITIKCSSGQMPVRSVFIEKAGVLLLRNGKAHSCSPLEILNENRSTNIAPLSFIIFIIL